MLVSELKEKLDGGKIEIDGLKIEQSNGDIHFHEGHTFLAYINDGNDDKEIANVINAIGGVLVNMSGLLKIAKYIGYDLSSLTITVEKEIVKEDTEKFLFKGMVEAYEKILIGREVTAGR